MAVRSRTAEKTNQLVRRSAINLRALHARIQGPSQIFLVLLKQELLPRCRSRRGFRVVRVACGYFRSR